MSGSALWLRVPWTPAPFPPHLYRRGHGPRPLPPSPHLYRCGHGCHRLLDGGEGRDGGQQHVVADQHVALHQRVGQGRRGNRDVGGHLGGPPTDTPRHGRTETQTHGDTETRTHGHTDTQSISPQSCKPHQTSSYSSLASLLMSHSDTLIQSNSQ